MINYSRKNIIKLVFVVVLLCSMLFGLYNFIFSYQELSVELPEQHAGLKAKLYRSAEHNPEVSHESYIKKENLIKDFDKSSTFRLKKGDYLLTTSSNEDFEAQTTEVSLKDEKVKTIVTTKLSEKKLQANLAVEKAALHATIRVAFPETSNGYIINQGKLFENGNWYGTTIVPNLSEEERRLNYVDIYRVVAAKQGGTWKVLTKPPELVLSYKKYPDIPKAILSEVNKLE